MPQSVLKRPCQQHGILACSGAFVIFKLMSNLENLVHWTWTIWFKLNLVYWTLLDTLFGDKMYSKSYYPCKVCDNFHVCVPRSVDSEMVLNKDFWIIQKQICKYIIITKIGNEDLLVTGPPCGNTSLPNSSICQTLL